MAIINIKPKDVVISFDILLKLRGLAPKPEPKPQPQKKEKENDSSNC